MRQTLIVGYMFPNERKYLHKQPLPMSLLPGTASSDFSFDQTDSSLSGALLLLPHVVRFLQRAPPERVPTMFIHVKKNKHNPSRVR